MKDLSENWLAGKQNSTLLGIRALAIDQLSERIVVVLKVCEFHLTHLLSFRMRQETRDWILSALPALSAASSQNEEVKGSEAELSEAAG